MCQSGQGNQTKISLFLLPKHFLRCLSWSRFKADRCGLAKSAGKQVLAFIFGRSKNLTKIRLRVSHVNKSVFNQQKTKKNLPFLYQLNSLVNQDATTKRFSLKPDNFRSFGSIRLQWASVQSRIGQKNQGRRFTLFETHKRGLFEAFSYPSVS